LRKWKDISWKRNPAEFSGELYDKHGFLGSLSVEGQILDMMKRILDVFLEKDTGAGAVVHPHRAAAAAAQKARFGPSKIVMIF